MNILLFNQYAGNKGDRAVLYATCQMLKRIHPDANIIVSTSSPELYDGYSYYKDNNIEFVTFLKFSSVSRALIGHLANPLKTSLRSLN
jgi:polysaccharide pyruvyl transferase WcaK-like protein